MNECSFGKKKKSKFIDYWNFYTTMFFIGMTIQFFLGYIDFVD